MQINPVLSPKTPVVRSAATPVAPQAAQAPADGVSLSQGYSTSELLEDLGKLRGLFAGPHEAMFQQRHAAETSNMELTRQGDDLESYRDNLQLMQPAVKGLAQAVREGKLDEVRQAGREAAQAASGNVFASFSLATLKNLDALADRLGGSAEKKLTDADWAVDGMLSLAAGIGDNRATQAADLDKALSHELFIGDERRQKLHPEPLLQGELSGDSLDGLSNWMLAESQTVDRQAQASAKQAHEAWSQVDTAQAKLNDHWQHRRENMGDRVAAAKVFLAKLDETEKSNPEIMRQLQAAAPDAIGLPKHLFPSGVLTSYRAQLQRHNGDASQLDWNKLLGQLERTSLS